MKMTIYNPQKCRLETREVTVNTENTTWFDNCLEPEGVYMITDTESGLLIRESNFNYPVLVYDVSRAEIDYDQQRAKELKEAVMSE